MYLLYTFILLTLVFPKNLDLSQFKISKELPENFKLNLKDENVNTRDEEILFTYDFEDGEEFTDENGNGLFDGIGSTLDSHCNYNYSRFIQ